MQIDDNRLHGSGIAGTLKLIAALAVIALALLAGLAVLEVIPRDMLKDAAVKVASLIGIGALASVALAALMWPSRRG